jgi:hypothetical protein
MVLFTKENFPTSVLIFLDLIFHQDWIDMTHDRNKWMALVSTVMNVLVP